MKRVQEIDLELKNLPGQTLSIAQLLGANGINIIGLYLSADAEEGRLRLLTNDPKKACNILKTSGYRIQTRDVVACEVPHHPGGLTVVLKSLNAAGIHIDYLYPCLATGDITVLVLGVDRVEEAVTALEGDWIRVLGEDLYHI